eukprot:scaffold610_cov352-Pavlova_lutheri.AAC.13
MKIKCFYQTMLAANAISNTANAFANGKNTDTAPLSLLSVPSSSVSLAGLGIPSDGGTGNDFEFGEHTVLLLWADYIRHIVRQVKVRMGIVCAMVCDVPPELGNEHRPVLILPIGRGRSHGICHAACLITSADEVVRAIRVDEMLKDIGFIIGHVLPVCPTSCIRQPPAVGPGTVLVRDCLLQLLDHVCPGVGKAVPTAPIPDHHRYVDGAIVEPETSPASCSGSLVIVVHCSVLPEVCGIGIIGPIVVAIPVAHDPLTEHQGVDGSHPFDAIPDRPVRQDLVGQIILHVEVPILAAHPEGILELSIVRGGSHPLASHLEFSTLDGIGFELVLSGGWERHLVLTHGLTCSHVDRAGHAVPSFVADALGCVVSRPGPKVRILAPRCCALWCAQVDSMAVIELSVAFSMSSA